MAGPASALRGAFLAIAAFTLWGLFPLYFHALEGVDPAEVLIHRIVGSALLLVLIGAFASDLGAALRELRQPRRVLFYLLTSVLISINWLIYIWATQNGRVLDASLGYFINPLVSVAFAMLFFNEALNRWQWLAVCIAGAAVVVSVIELGELPWVALSLAASFATYGLLRKKAGVPPRQGLLIETALLAPPALIWLWHLDATGNMALFAQSTHIDLLLALAGVVTVAPLFLWLSSMPHLRYSTLGLLQYITPTLQFIIGLVLGEALIEAKLTTFALIWLALGIYSLDGWRARGKTKNGDRSPRV